MLSIHALLLSCGALCAVLLSSHAQAAVSGKTVEYQDGDTVCEGYLALDDSTAGPRPAVLVFHDWMGLTDHTRDVCKQLAALGYDAFAADMYGKGVRPEDAKAAGALAGKYKADRATTRRRAEAALAQLQKSTQVQAGKTAAIGYCFGGTCALELVRDGAPIAGVVSFHGGLDSPNPEDGKNIKAKLLILHGADDPYVKKEDIEAFQNELRAAKVDWEMTYYANAVHAFTEPWAGHDNSKGAAYNPEAARRSWQAMKDFFGELFPAAAK
jgi:dienelactone hydrolase